MINLLSPERKKQLQAERLFNQLLSLFVYLFVITVIISAIIYLLNSELKEKNIALKDEKAIIEKDRIKYKELESKVNLINGRIVSINKILDTRINWPVVLTDLASLTPKSIKINSLSTSQVKTGKTSLDQISITGVSSSLETIEEFRKSLDDSKKFQSSTFKTASLDNNSNNFTFTLTTILRK